MGRRPNTLCSLTGQELETGELAAGTMVRGVRGVYEDAFGHTGIVTRYDGFGFIPVNRQEH